MHRDLKPANILLGADGPLIGDFGIAHDLDSTHITGTGFVTGTPAYLAPEQITGEPAGPAADVYALGLILLECLTAEREYPGTMTESALARLHRSPHIPDGLPGPLAHTLTRMTAREPEHRPTAHEALQMLRQPTTTHTSTSVTGRARVPGFRAAPTNPDRLERPRSRGHRGHRGHRSHGCRSDHESRRAPPCFNSRRRRTHDDRPDPLGDACADHPHPFTGNARKATCNGARRTATSPARPSLTARPWRPRSQPQ
ncbi:serine/threonine-protein kinase [Amycolatopsis sp. NPDC023774]|uniref:serine/threonine-protein kinase n=1 Tax=Amycolatopsis sp. NPDC023774 TaxID=3155015 RepID=UPI0033D27604